MGMMGMPAKMPELDFYGCPEYYVTDGVTLPTGDGNTRFYAWVMKGSIAVPLYTAVIVPSKMALIGRGCTQTAEQVFNARPLLDIRPAH